MFLLYVATVSVIFDAIISTVREQAHVMEIRQAERLSRILIEETEDSSLEVKVARASHALVITKAFRCASEAIDLRMKTLPAASIYSSNTLKERVKLSKNHDCSELEDHAIYAQLEKKILNQRRAQVRTLRSEKFWPYQKALQASSPLRAPANGEVHEAKSAKPLTKRFEFTEFSKVPHRAPSTVAIHSLRCSFFFLQATLFGGSNDYSDDAALVDKINASCGAVENDISNRIKSTNI